MMLNLNRFKKKYPQFTLKLSTNPVFGAVDRAAEAASYSKNMMDTKICLVPRGTTFETYRFFEAMRYGCIIITEPLPPRWFYRGAPVIELTNWDNLEAILKQLLENQKLMQELHLRTLKHWEERCSEVAVGSQMAVVLSGVLVKRFSQMLVEGESSLDWGSLQSPTR